MGKKTIYLFLALGLPVLIFLFLRIFGKNHFDIPLYYQSGVPDSLAHNNTFAKGQYFLPDSSLKKIEWKNGVTLFVSNATMEERNELTQVTHHFNSSHLQIINLDSLKSTQQELWKNSILFLKKPWQAVLVDNQKRIRGYYALNNREELDRLEVEADIILNP